MRITEKFIEKQVERLNFIINKQTKPENNFFTGYFDIDYGYSGVQLVRYTNDNGSCEDVLRTGHVEKRKLSELIAAFETGLMFNKKG